MTDNFNLNRFLDAQRNNYDCALKEIRAGYKHTHWMWYIFPQIKGLGKSTDSKIFEIRSAEEAKSYLRHPILGSRLIEITTAFLILPDKTAFEVFGEIDSLKMKSCMTLFASVQNDIDVFSRVLNVYYMGEYCEFTRSQIDVK